MSTYTSAEYKLRVLAVANAALQANLGGSDPSTFRWYDRQLAQNVIAKTVATKGACVRVRRVGTVRDTNQGGIMNLSRPRLQIDVLDLDGEKARIVANDVIEFLGTVNLCSNGQFQSPFTGPSQNPVVLLSQRADMIPNPLSPGGPIYVESIDIRIANREDLSIN